MKGMIVMWSGAIVDIPDGWALCDGTGGTPDLTDRFVIGAGGAYNPDDTGGAVAHDHDFTSDTHDHLIPSGSQIADGTDREDSTNSVAVTGTTDPKNALPPYYALAFIIKE